MDLLKNFFKGDKAIWIIYLFLCLISIVEVFSASSTLTYKSGDHQTDYQPSDLADGGIHRCMDCA